MMAGALDGIRVVDFSRVFAGPAATQLLGDLGAEIIKIEEPGTGDSARVFGATEAALQRFGGVSASYLALNRNKRSITLDLHIEEARAVALRLAAQADVVVHNFRPGVMQRWGLSYDAVRALNPRCVYCEFSAYGQTGAMARVGANDVALQAHSGLISITGEEGGEGVRSGTSVVDLQGALAMDSGILAALFHRERTGEGQYIETSLLRASAHLMGNFYTEYWLDGTIREPMGTANHLNVPNQAFPASDGRVIIIASGDKMWRRCAHALDAAQLDRPEFAKLLDRRRRRAEVVEALSAVTSSMTCAELLQRLSAVEVTIAKVHSVGEAADHPQLAAINGVVDFRFDGHAIRSVAAPFDMSATPPRMYREPPMLGAHTDEVLRQFGYDCEQIAALRRVGAIGPTATASERTPSA
jgi:crotonobetainyl-CoA:carnitine CoA-transferase CaiB-like acyl-CoA transferase